MKINVTMAQIQSIAGDLIRNRDRILVAAEQGAEEEFAHVVLTPEMSLTGYPIDDLIGDADFHNAVNDSLAYLTNSLPHGVLVAVGTPRWIEDLPNEITQSFTDNSGPDSEKRKVVNTLTLFLNGEEVGCVIKRKLPTYGVFDDSRWFAQNPEKSSPVIKVNGVTVGFAICEDIWDETVVNSLVRNGAEVILVANASPYTESKQDTRVKIVSEHASRLGVPIVYVNMYGGQDEVVYDGASFTTNSAGELVSQFPAFESFTHTVSIPIQGKVLTSIEGKEPRYHYPETNAATYSALVTGLRDYVNRVPGITGIVIGLSGGLDSALAATIAVDALGAGRVLGIAMPGPYSSEHSVSDAIALATNLGIEFRNVSISETFHSELGLLGDLLEGPGRAIAVENIQARLRALHLMTIANTRGMIVLNTGNKSEASVGYFTLGGDSSGGFAILKDVYKTRAYDLSKWRNAHTINGIANPIPLNSIDKPPSAELAPGQQDTDSLPPYPVLDSILKMWLEERLPVNVIASAISDKFDYPNALETVRKVTSMTLNSEHKRRQVAPGVKVTEKSYGKDRRYPIVNMYRP